MLRLTLLFFAFMLTISACSNNDGRADEQKPVKDSLNTPNEAEIEAAKEILEYLNTDEVKQKIYTFMEKYLEWINSPDYYNEMHNIISTQDTTNMSPQQASFASRQLVQYKLESELKASGFQTFDDLKEAVNYICMMDTVFFNKIQSYNEQISFRNTVILETLKSEKK